MKARVIYISLIMFCLIRTIQAESAFKDPVINKPVSATATSEAMDCLLEPNDEVKLSSQVPGILNRIMVERGDLVKQWQPVAELKSGVEQAAVELAKAKVQFGKRKLVRNEELYKKELISIHEKDEMETEYQISELELKEAQEKLKLRTIYSTINGVVIERHHSPGEYISDAPILTLASIDPLNVEIIVPSSQLGKIKKGMTAYVYPELSGNRKYKGVVEIVDSIVDAASGTFTIRVRLPNPGNKISAGLKCKVAF
ncbi:MAG: efflux RND transporter periplasmic adaptor subunit [Gammaproteobacteria bacterium]|nr:efflux RND transporter periplasmic adaptor subunit [Gammaproteobacteria bacterium]